MLNQHKTIKDSIEKFNQVLPLAPYLIPFIGDKKEIRVADIASGPISKIGQYYEDVVVEVFPSDSQNFDSFYKKYKFLPIYPIEYQNMEALTYKDEFFDIVHCANALDHTKDAYKAVQEMIRVCKKGGYIYIDCCLDQKDTGHKHYWNAKEDGVMVNDDEIFNLQDFGFKIEYIDNGAERRYNHIIATMQK